MSRLRDFLVARALAGNHDPLDVPGDVLAAFEQRVKDNACVCHLVAFTDDEVDAIIRRNTN